MRLRLAALGWFTLALACAQPLKPGRNDIPLGSRSEPVYYLRATGVPRVPNEYVFLLTGQAGWSGLPKTIGENMAQWGRDLYAWDTSGYPGTDPKRAMADVRSLLERVRSGQDRAILVGWREGAELALLTGASTPNQPLIRGIMALEPPPGAVEPFLPRIAPVPVLLFYATSSTLPADRLFASLREPKQLVRINSHDPQFTGNRTALLNALRGAFGWIAQQTH